MNVNFVRVLVWVCASAVSGIAPAGASPPAGLGRWLTESGNLEIDIGPCGEALCGTVVKVLGNRSMSHPDKSRAAVDAKAVMGMKILSDFAPAGESQWQGRIYNRENGKTYDCRMTQLSPDLMKIRAFRVLPLFGKTQIWKRVARPARSSG